MDIKFKEGFTLVEIVIVISIIGILSFVFYPKIIGYIERAREVEEQQLIIGFNEMFREYVIDKGEVESQVAQATEEFEDYCLEDHVPGGVPALQCQPGYSSGPYAHHIGLNNYFQSSERGRILLSKRDYFCEKYWGTGNWCGWTYGLFSKRSYKRLYDWGYIFPGANNADTTKLNWSVGYLKISDNYDTIGWNVTGGGKWIQINGNNMPLSLNKRCAPGVAGWAYVSTGGSSVECWYLLTK